MKKIFSVLLLFAVFSSLATAQIINVEKKRKGDKNGFQGAALFEFSMKKTSKNVMQSKNNIDLQYSRGAQTFIFLGGLKLLRVDDSDITNTGFSHFRYNYTIRDSSFLTLEAFVQYQYNETKLLKTRMISGIGPRFRISNQKKFQCYFAPLAMYEYELLSDSLNTDISILRVDAYLNFIYSINKYVSFSNIVYYQPAFKNFNDYRISSETGLRFNINKFLSLSILYSAEYDSEPPENVDNLFYSFINRLIIKF